MEFDLDLPASTKLDQPGEPPKWGGKAHANLLGPRPEQVWSFLEDFFDLSKWFPTLITCEPADGAPLGRPVPGCVRYCAGFKTPVDEKAERAGETRPVNWTKQKLLSIDPVEMTLSYSIVDSNVGFNSYVSKLKVVPNEEGCSIEWDYEVEAVEGWCLEELDQFIGFGLQVMAKRMGLEALTLSKNAWIDEAKPEQVAVSN